MKIKELKSDFLKGLRIIQIDRYNPCYHVTYKGNTILIGASPDVLKEMFRKNLPIPPKIFVPLAEINLFGDNLHLEFPYYWVKYIIKAKGGLEVIGRKDELEQFVIPRLEEAIGTSFALDTKHPYTALARFDVRELIKFTELSKNQPYQFYDLTIEQKGYNVFIKREKWTLAKLDLKCHHRFFRYFKERKKKIEIKERPFSFTVIGSGSGFIYYRGTSSKILHFGKQNIWIDPPARPLHRIERLRPESRIKPQEITAVIITHLHEDHDAGLIPLILYSYQILNKKMRVMTTKIIFKALIRKFGPLLKKSTGFDIRKIVDISVLDPGKPLRYQGAIIECRYNWHNLEALGLKFTYDGKIVAFSGDHLANDETIHIAEKLAREAESQGLTPIIKSKYFKFMHFEWLDADVIVHEAGIPPIHTTEQQIEKLSKALLEGASDRKILKIYVEHTDKFDIVVYKRLKQYMAQKKAGDGKQREILFLGILKEGKTIPI